MLKPNQTHVAGSSRGTVITPPSVLFVSAGVSSVVASTHIVYITVSRGVNQCMFV